MKRILIAIFITLLTTSIPASEPDQYLCIEDEATGFKWVNGKWKQVNFVPSKYVLKRADPNISNHNAVSTAWVLITFGDKNQSPDAFCNQDFNEGGFLHCSGSAQFKLWKETMYFGMSHITSAVHTEKPSDCPKEVKPSFSVEYLNCGMDPDSMTLSYGKCSPF